MALNLNPLPCVFIYTPARHLKVKRMAALFLARHSILKKTQARLGVRAVENEDSLVGTDYNFHKTWEDVVLAYAISNLQHERSEEPGVLLLTATAITETAVP
ncbi:LOW QUALITY PROTEIN: hypothetical protein CVT26_004711 [Gymnopilus dilepis]|uniref:Uncharacterized protein n=1 Tax=Gymnopilus dilepis TaxID=231916 RepID=A0A409XZC9_9AGAR|nr:LOW QUALITY PROTEIN: hypothetical protein CVT26_004711 [Gymnopilus dilepis]